MKYIVSALMTITVVVLIAFAILTINVRQQREVEVSEALEHSVKEALCNMTQDRRNEIFGEVEEDYQKAVIANFCELLIGEIEAGTKNASDDNLNLKVEVAGVDYDKGLLSVRVTEGFSYPLFGRGNVSVSATAVVDTDYDKTVNTVTFYDKDGRTIYKKYVVPIDVSFPKPSSNPWTGDDGVWTDMDGKEYRKNEDWPEDVSQSYSFKAVY